MWLRRPHALSRWRRASPKCCSPWGWMEQIVGVTEFCDFPAGAKAKSKVGYANPNLESLIALRPSVDRGAREFHRANVRPTGKLKIPVLLPGRDPSLEKHFSHLHTLGRIFDRSVAAACHDAGHAKPDMAELTARTERLARVRVLYVINSEPLSSRSGRKLHPSDDRACRWGEYRPRRLRPILRLTMETVLKEDPEILLFPQRVGRNGSAKQQEAWRRWTTVTAVRQNRLRAVSADALNRPGPRVMDGLESLVHGSTRSLSV